jgi:hypothetical protein
MKQLLIGLGACGLAALSLHPQAVAATAPAAPAFHWKWVLTINSDGASIGEHTDDEANSIYCEKPYKGKIDFHLHVETDPPKSDPPWKTQMTVTAGAASVTVAAKADDNEDAGGSDVTITLPVTSPVVIAFGKTGALKMKAMGYTSDSPALPAAMAAKLVKTCAG